MLPDGKAANVPFFSLLIQKIEESDTLTLQFDLPAFIQKLLLQTPRHLSSFLRFVRRHVHKAFSKQSFSSLKDIPVMLQAKPSVVGDVCENAGISEDWLFHSQAFYSGKAAITIGLILELMAINRSKSVTDAQCSVWIQRLFHLDVAPHPGTIRMQWERIATRAANCMLKHKKEERENYLRCPYQPPSKIAKHSVPVKENETIHEVMSDNVASVTVETSEQATQSEKHFPTLAELSSIVIKRSLTVNELDIQNIEQSLDSEPKTLKAKVRSAKQVTVSKKTTKSVSIAQKLATNLKRKAVSLKGIDNPWLRYC